MFIRKHSNYYDVSSNGFAFKSGPEHQINSPWKMAIFFENGYNCLSVVTYVGPAIADRPKQ